jgi:hypothetical protein
MADRGFFPRSEPLHLVMGCVGSTGVSLVSGAKASELGNAHSFREAMRAFMRFCAVEERDRNLVYGGDQYHFFGQSTPSGQVILFLLRRTHLCLVWFLPGLCSTSDGLRVPHVFI